MVLNHHLPWLNQHVPPFLVAKKTTFFPWFWNFKPHFFMAKPLLSMMNNHHCSMLLQANFRRTWSEVYARSRQLCSALKARGVGRGDVPWSMADLRGKCRFCGSSHGEVFMGNAREMTTVRQFLWGNVGEMTSLWQFLWGNVGEMTSLWQFLWGNPREMTWNDHFTACLYVFVIGKWYDMIYEMIWGDGKYHGESRLWSKRGMAEYVKICILMRTNKWNSEV